MEFSYLDYVLTIVMLITVGSIVGKTLGRLRLDSARTDVRLITQELILCYVALATSCGIA